MNAESNQSPSDKRRKNVWVVVPVRLVAYGPARLVQAHDAAHDGALKHVREAYHIMEQVTVGTLASKTTHT